MSVILNPIRSTVRQFMARVARALNRVTDGRLHPNVVTLVGLIAHLYIAYLIAGGSLILAGVLLVIFGLFDALDGALAREQGRTSKTGMLLDSVTDRLKEVALYAGIGYYLIISADIFYAVWATIACGISIIVSYVNAWGEVVVKDKKATNHVTNRAFRTGFMTFEVRMFTLVVGLLSGYVKEAVVVVAIFAFITAVERFYLITKKL